MWAFAHATHVCARSPLYGTPLRFATDVACLLSATNLAVVAQLQRLRPDKLGKWCVQEIGFGLDSQTAVDGSDCRHHGRGQRRRDDGPSDWRETSPARGVSLHPLFARQGQPRHRAVPRRLTDFLHEVPAMGSVRKRFSTVRVSKPFRRRSSTLHGRRRPIRLHRGKVGRRSCAP